MLDAARGEPVLRWRAVIGACGFAAFGSFWTTVTFLLAAPRYHFSTLQIGLFALAGVAGATSAACGGRLLGPGGRHRWLVTGAALLALAGSFCLIDAGGRALGWLIAGTWRWTPASRPPM